MRSGKNTTLKMSFSTVEKISSNRGSIALDPPKQNIGHAEGVCFNGQGRIGPSRGGHESSIGDIEIIKVPGATVRVENGILGICAKPCSAQDVIGTAGQGIFCHVDTTFT